MTYDAFVNTVVDHLSDEGLLRQPRPITIDGKTYFEEVWAISFHKEDNGYHYASFCLSKVVEKTENTNPVIAMIRDENSTNSAYELIMNVAYANDISNFYPVKVYHIYLSIYLNAKDDTIRYTTNKETTFDLKATDYKKNGYPSKDYPGWTTSSNGYGSFVKRELVGDGILIYKDEYESVFSMPAFITSYGAYEYFVGGADVGGDFSTQTVWNVYVDPRHSDGDYLDPNIKIAWHNELLDEFLSAGGDGSAYSVKVWGGIPKLRSDASGGMEIQTIEIGEYDYSVGNLLTSYSGVYTEASNAHGTDFLYELFHGKMCYILFAVYKSGEQCSSLCYISCKNKVPDTSTTANVIDYGQVGDSFMVLLDNKINDVSIVNVSIGTGEDDNGANNDNNDDDEGMDNHNVDNSMELLTAGLTSVYNVTPEKLNQLGRFIWTDDAMDNIKLLNNSPIQNIVSCKCIPFSASGTSAKNIVLGNIDTGVTGNKVSSNIGKILIGSVNVTPPFNNFLSYGNYTSVSIYLPYLGMRQLDTDKVMGKTLKVYYNVDCLSGNCVIELFSNNVKINEFSCNVSIDIALTSSNRAEIEKGYITSAVGGGVSLATGNVVGALGSGLNASMQKYNYAQSGSCSGSAYTNISKNCYIIIEYPDLLNNSSYKHLKGKPCEKRKRIGNCKGFTTISNVDLQVKATETEINAIKELLSSGVYL